LNNEVQERVKKNLPLVEHIVTRMANKLPAHLERQDLVQAGMVGLIEASQRFDMDRGTAFSTFAGRRIEGAIIDVVRRDDWLPRSLRSRARTVSTVEQDFFNEAGRYPSDEELAELAGITVDELVTVRSRVHRGVVLALDYAVGGDEGNTTLGDTIPDKSALDMVERLEDREMKAYVRSAIHLLPERHRLVVVAYFLDERPMDEIASILGVTQSRISQLKDDALKRIREGLSAQFESADTTQSRPTRRRVDQRKISYASAIAGNSTMRQRLNHVVV